jgi:thymidylate kinase
MGEGFFCVLLGPDGAGKSTVLDGIRRSRPQWRCVSAQPEDLYPLPGLACYDWPLRTHPRTYVSRMRPYTRAGFYITTLSVEYEYHIRPGLEEGRLILCDSYWYRFAAKERLQNPAGYPALRSFVDLLPQPDLVIWLRVPFEVAGRRKDHLTAFEVAGGPGLTGFTRFQQEVDTELRRQLRHVPQHVVDGTASRSAVRDKVIEAIESAAPKATPASDRACAE